MSSDKQEDVCNVCANHYTAVLRKKLTCPYCAATNCSQCLSTYLMGLIGDPACMHCRVSLSDAYLSTALTKTYIKGPLFKQRQAVLILRTRVELPRLQERAQQEKKRRDNDALLKPFRDAESALRSPFRAARARMYAAERDAQRIFLRANLPNPADRSTPEQIRVAVAERDDARVQYRAISMQLRTAQEKTYVYRQQLRRNEPVQAVVAAEPTEEKKFIRRCTRPNCQGFLSTAWKCGLCEWYSCSQCFTPRGEKHDTPHECKKEDVDSAELIKKDSKPCPKCGEYINKSEGCQQMFCIICKTAFDWGTGKIVTNGIIHNPHYYEWLKRAGGGAMPRNPADIPCGGYPAAYQLVELRYCRTIWMRTALSDFHRMAMEAQDVSENQYRTYIDQHGFDNSNIKFLLGDINEKKWGQLLASHEKKRKRDREVQDVFAAFRMVAVELINRLQNYRTPAGLTIASLRTEEVDQMVQEFAEEAHGLIMMINAAFQKIGETAGCRVPYFHPRLHNPHRFMSMVHAAPPECSTNYIIGVKTFEMVSSRVRTKEERVSSDSEEEEEPAPPAQAARPASYDSDSDSDRDNMSHMGDDTHSDGLRDDVDDVMDDAALNSDEEITQIQTAIANSLKISHEEP